MSGFVLSPLPHCAMLSLGRLYLEEVFDHRMPTPERREQLNNNEQS